MRIEEIFRKVFGSDPEVVARAPGRVNLIGEHTDYNEGFVLPAAIDRYCWYAGRKRSDGLVRAYSADFASEAQFALKSAGRDERQRWSNYLRGVSKLIEDGGAGLPGADIAFGGDVPREAGLSSSAAVEVGAAAFWKKLAGLSLDGVALARLAQKAENEFVGVPSGIMDQFVSALGRRDHALFLDCRDLRYRHVPLRADTKIIVCNSGVKRSLAQSEYGIRTEQCREAVETLRSAGFEVHSLRDAKPADLEPALSGVLLRRARHVVTENERVLEAVRALEADDLGRFGELMNQSHASLRDDYEVSSPELDILAELALKQPGVYGARMTGAGFGGCTVNLVRPEAAADFAEAVRKGYEKAVGMKAEVYTFQASAGALETGL
ncbi:MAG: galactokinase [Acidobacteriota bacterium]|nr:galactokinase [Acidobacteriota bacterium]